MYFRVKLDTLVASDRFKKFVSIQRGFEKMDKLW